MKKLSLLIAMFLCLGVATSSAQTQDLKFGVHAGLPTGDYSDAFNFNLGADVSYLWGVAGIVEAGPLLGYLHYFGESGEEGETSWEVDDAQFVPIAASGRVDLGVFFAGLDLGYALGLNDGNDGGFFYRPKVGFGFMGLKLIGSYSGVSVEESSLSSINVGVEFGL